MTNNEVTQLFRDIKKMPCFEMDNGELIYFQYNENTNKVECGSVCNAGLIVEYRFTYDKDLPLDVNLQGIYEQLSELQPSE